ncbi:cell division protease ftsH [Phytophthora infestans T30-4]|uniref:Cell division protease ftsH n=1 Tax=Phytophthora infestans (strain T30-4) TaxID=403677 RepID=D0NQX0_PHYIT|nr:cell division protease ftsH [Phytophthora infestans T30-4]EEY63068.1 cell division protease ftsH [Phytophthora infestans T30-4]|eukprot:XP_002898591.1 cell division protease ftsH [Phytophthora infestans T30-4]
MRVPSARRFMTALCVLLLAGKGAQKLRLFVASMLAKFRALTATGSPTTPAWRLFSVFLGDLKDHRVGKVLLAGDHCIVQAKDGAESYKVLVPPRTENTYILDALVRSGVAFGSVPPSTSSKLLPVAIALMPFLYLGLTYKMLRGMYGPDAGAVGKDGTKKVRKQQETERISFDDVAGIDGARKELEEVVDFLRHPTRYHAIGAKVPKGVLLCGPSGTGKTLLARAVASEAGVAFLFCSASDFVEMLVGRGAARVRDLFTQASQYPQCIIFIDEIDALAKARGGLNSNDEREQTLNQLLTEMDGFEGNVNGVIVIAATNRPEVLDPALCRPGRFDRHVYVGFPDAKGRQEILEVHCRNVKLDSEVDLAVVAEQCGPMGQRSGAQLASLVNEAALLAVRHGDTSIKYTHFEQAMNRAFASQTRNIAGSSFEFAMEEA